jgi:hypothetical protein
MSLDDRKARMVRPAAIGIKKDQTDAAIEKQSRDRLIKLNISLASAEEKRADSLANMLRERCERTRRQKETLAQTKRKQEREQREYWARMKEREFVVQFRREQLRIIPRSKMLQADVAQKTQLTEAAALITGIWLRGKIRPLVRAFLATGIIDIAGEEQNYPKMQEAMMDKHNISIASDLILRIIQCDPIAASTTHRKRSGRILLTALLLEKFNEQVMPDAQGDELSLLEHAGALSESLQHYLSAPYRANQVLLAESWSVFSESFSIWQAADCKTLVADMQADYISLQQIAGTLGKEARQEWMPHIHRHQERLKTALMRVAGKAAITDLQDKLVSMASQPEEELKVEKTREPLSFERRLLTEDERKSIEESFGETSGPSKVLNNVQIAHEMMVDEHFNYHRLMELKTGRPHVAEIAPVVGDIKTFLDFVLLLKSQLLEILQGKGPLAIELSTNLEENFLRDQLANNALEPHKLVAFLVEMMSKMCAPARDEAIASLCTQLDSGVELDELCKKVGEIALLLHEDLANYHLRSLRPALAQQIVAYERDWFARTILNKATPHSEQLSNKIWKAIEGQLKEKKPLAQVHGVIAEIVLLFMGLGQESVKNMNDAIDSFELLELDATRIRKLAERVKNVATISALDLALRTLGHPIDDTITRLWTLIQTGAPENAIQAEATRKVNETMLADATSSAVRRILEGHDPIVLLLTRRMGTMLRNTLFEETEHFTPKPIAILVRNGLAEIAANEYNDLARQILTMFRLHCQVLAPVYHGFLHLDQK